MYKNTPADNNKKGEKRVFKRAKGLRLAWTEVIACVIVIFCLGFFLGRISVDRTVYKGLGESKEIPANPYDSAAFYSDDKGRLHYNDGTYSSITVMDVSYAQGEINWQKVKDDEIDMVMIRLGYRGYVSGLINLDEYFEANVKGAKEAGIKAGVYFFSQAVNVEEAEEEAKFAVKYYKKNKLKGPIAFDMEPIKGAHRISDLTDDEKSAIADAFLTYVEKKGYEGFLYGNPKWMKGSLELDKLTQHKVWLAHYTERTDYPYWYTMWQYTATGKVKGIKGDVDLSIMFVEN